VGFDDAFFRERKMIRRGMKTVRGALMVLAGAAAFAAGTPAFAFLVDFNGVSNSSNSSVQTYLDNLLGKDFVKVYGAVATQTYTGDNYVNRIPSGNTYAGQYMTLGYTDGAASPTDYGKAHATTIVDKFLTNAGGEPTTHTPWGSSGNDKIVMVFRDPLFNVSFDWEIFPNGSCGRCGATSLNYPDFQLWAGTDGASAATYIYPASAFPVSAPNSYPQGLGHFSATFAQPVTRLEFVDWPVKIGIDNLDPNRVPEPGSIVLLGIGLAAVALRRRRSS
jgi:hypothetical protein